MQRSESAVGNVPQPISRLDGRHTGDRPLAETDMHVDFLCWQKYSVSLVLRRGMGLINPRGSFLATLRQLEVINF